MKILLIGGTGIISSAVSESALARGMEVTLLNRGTSFRPVPEGARVIHADVRNPQEVREALGPGRFDVVVDFISFVPHNLETTLQGLGDHFGQYIFISSASAYRKPSAALPVVESQALHNPWWEYSRNKIACENHLMDLWRRESLPVTIVRPSHTYDRTLLPFDGGWSVVDRMLRGLDVIVHGDGTSLWTLTHHKDFAHGLLGLFAHPHALGEAFHITGDEWLSWNDIFGLTARAFGCEAKLVHIPSRDIAHFDPDWGAGLLGDKSWSMLFDNSKLRRLVPDYRPSIPFCKGILEVAAWYREHPEHQVVDTAFLERYERILAWHGRP